MNILIQNLIIEWSNKFPLDRWYRKKYNLSFNSEKHRESNPIDIYYEFMEDRIFDKYVDDMKEYEEKEKLIEQGQWITNRYNTGSTSEEMKNFQNIPLEAFNNMIADAED